MPRHTSDIALLLTILALVVFGLMMVGSATAVIGERYHNDAFYYIKHQFYYGTSVGIASFLIGYFVNYGKWRLLALPALVISLLFLALVFFPGLTVSYGGSSRWIGIGPITIQPSEITKLAFILYIAALLEKKGEDIHNFKKSVAPFIVITGTISLLIVLQPDIGTLFVITVIAFTMVYAAGFRLRHLALIGIAGTAIFTMLISMAQYRLNRLFVYLHPEIDPQGIGYQINQALLAIGTGGVWGLGFGRSRQKYYYLPEPGGDSIFAIIGEELGMIRSLLIIGAFAFIAWKGYRIAEKAPDMFGKLVATGTTSWIVFQAFINIGSILAITPLTGIPLPFISYGGSALASILFSCGVLLNISKHTVEKD